MSSINKYAEAFYAYERENEERPTVLILDDIRKHQELLWDIRFRPNFFGCKIYVAKNANFGFEYHTERDLHALLNVKILDRNARSVSYSKQQFKCGLIANYPSCAPDLPTIPVTVAQKIVEIDIEALRAYQNNMEYKGMF